MFIRLALAIIMIIIYQINYDHSQNCN